MDFKTFLNLESDQLDAIIADIQDYYGFEDFDEACSYITYAGLVFVLERMADSKAIN